MGIDEKTLWDKKHSERSHSSLQPDPFLVSAYDEFLFGTTPGLALDVAGGVGRHSIWLAQRGWTVKLLDISEIGIQQAEENAKRTGTAGSISSEVRNLNIMQDLGTRAIRSGYRLFLFAARTLPFFSGSSQAGWVSGL